MVKVGAGPTGKAPACVQVDRPVQETPLCSASALPPSLPQRHRILSCGAHRGVFLSELAGELDCAGKASLTQGWEAGPPKLNSRARSLLLLFVHQGGRLSTPLQLLFADKLCTFCFISSRNGVLPVEHIRQRPSSSSLAWLQMAACQATTRTAGPFPAPMPTATRPVLPWGGHSPVLSSCCVYQPVLPEVGRGLQHLSLCMLVSKYDEFPCRGQLHSHGAGV